MQDKAERGMKYSIKTQMVAAAVAAVAVFFAAFFLANNFLLPRFYQKHKMNDMIDLYQELSALEKNGTIAEIEKEGIFKDESAHTVLREMTEKQNLDFVVINTDNQPVIYASRENDRIQDELLSFLFQRDTGGVIIADTDDYEIVKSDPAEKGGRGQGQQRNEHREHQQQRKQLFGFHYILLLPHRAGCEDTNKVAETAYYPITLNISTFLMIFKGSSVSFCIKNRINIDISPKKET